MAQVFVIHFYYFLRQVNELLCFKTALTEIGMEAKEYMDKGHLVPDTLMVRLVLDEIKKKNYDRLLLDGFPRTVPQAFELEKHLRVDIAINLDVPKDTIIGRISSRWLHPASGRVYAYDYNPPKKIGFDDETGEPLVQRADDRHEAVSARLEAYASLTAPLLSHFGQVTFTP